MLSSQITLLDLSKSVAAMDGFVEAEVHALELLCLGEGENNTHRLTLLQQCGQCEQDFSVLRSKTYKAIVCREKADIMK